MSGREGRAGVVPRRAPTRAGRVVGAPLPAGSGALSDVRHAAAACAIFVALAGATGPASAAAYRCTVGGKVTYSDQPCLVGTGSGTGSAAGTLVGTQRTVDLPDPHVPPAERAAAEARARADRAELAGIDRRKTTEIAEDRRAAAVAARRDTERSRQARACDQLARTVRRTHDDFDVAGPREQPKARLRMQRADQEFAALCKRRS